ncbi:MAG: hypothetical protein JXQ75_19915 [Phycisphaerae bacterium]|nr:hypothetical protein [Phycisphaerae bacterium]
MDVKRPPGHSRSWAAASVTLLALAVPLVQCYPTALPTAGTVLFRNTADPTNNNAEYIGQTLCAACHVARSETFAAHGHHQALSRITGAAPGYNAQGSRAGVPNPPAGLTWNDISYAISGYTHGAFFVNSNGYLLTDGAAGTNTQWNLAFPPNGTAAGFVAYEAAVVAPTPYEYDCFRCHTVRPRQPADASEHQDDLPGILGTWAEAGVQCEACHGPGRNHIENTSARDLYIPNGTTACSGCHVTDPDDTSVIGAADGFVGSNAQWPELRASGGHSDFSCMTCHDPHTSITYDRENAVRNACTACHADVNMASHQDVTFVRSDYQEEMTCESCHMPFSGRSVSEGAAAVVGTNGGRMGDVRSHIFRINTANADYSAMFNTGGTRVATDSEGRAAVTLDFVCLRCHNATGNAFTLTVMGAASVAADMHTNVPGS